ncbi:MAG TPA: hypothetical protein VEG68_01940 [Terriglobales bacterium]|nr:hypothetical protein [Terriglobales bacterium]
MAALAIVWRNPKQVRNRLRWSQQGQTGGRTVYTVEQLLSAERDVWVNASVLELICGRQTVRAFQGEPRRWRFGFGW